MNEREYLEKRGKLAARIEELRKRQKGNEEWRAEDQAELEKVTQEWADLKSAWDAAQNARNRVAELDRLDEELRSTPAQPQSHPAPDRREQRGGPLGQNDPEHDYRLARAGWFRTGTRHDATDEMRAAAQRVGLDLGSRTLEIPVSMNYETRAETPMLAGTPATGGHTVPPTLVQRLEAAVIDYGGIIPYLFQLNTTTGNQIEYPMIDDLNNEAEYVKEGAKKPEAAAPTLDKVSIGAYKLVPKPIKISEELLQDSFVNMESLIAGLIGERIWRKAAKEAIGGTGTDAPTGLKKSVTHSVTSGTVGKITFDDILQLVHSVDPAHRNGPSVRFAFHDSTLLQLAMLKDLKGQYIWQPNVAGGVGDKIFNRPYTIDNGIDEIAAGNDAIFFGNFSKIICRRAGGYTVQRLSELYAENGMVGFLASIRWDIKPLWSPNWNAKAVPMRKLTIKAA